MNKDTLVVVASAAKEVVTPSMVDMTVEKERQSSLEDTSLLGYFPPLSTPVTNMAGNAPGKKVAYLVVANYVRNTWGKYRLVHSMFNSSTRLFSFQFISMDALDAMLRMVKLYGIPVTAFSEDGLSVIATKLGFKSHNEYQPVSKKSTASSSGNKKKGVEPTIEVSNSNPFDVLNSVNNDVEFGTNRGTTNLVNNKATSSGSSFMHINNDGEFASNTPIESDSEVEVVFDDIANLRISTSGKDESDKGYGTNSLLEK
nr:hypothetical protein [Tanacetum cinerariifolium]